MPTYELITTNDAEAFEEQVNELAGQGYHLAGYSIAYWPNVLSQSPLWHSALMVIEDEE